MNVELTLLSVMLKSGDFSPIIRGEITEEHFETDQGKVLHGFIVNYRSESDGKKIYPSLRIVRERFKNSAIELPDPDEGDNIHNLVHETRQAKFRSDLRKISQEAEEIANSSKDPFEQATTLLSKFRKASEPLQTSRHLSLATSIAGIAEDYKNKEILPEGIPMPWPSLSKAVHGMQPKTWTLIAGRPKSRKTFTALRLGTHAVKHHQSRLLVFSPEMPARQMMLRIVAHLCDLPYSEFKDSSMQQAEEMRLYEAVQLYGKFEEVDDKAYQMQFADSDTSVGTFRMPSIDVLESSGRDTTWMASQIEIYKPDIIIVDSFYLHRAQGFKKHDSDWKAVGALSREMKALVMETGVVGIGTHQLNREAQRAVGSINNLSFADGVSQDADHIYRVVTGTIEGNEVSAFYNMAARETKFDGVMIRNCPCYDYSELGIITSEKQVLNLMKQEEDREAQAEQEALRARAREGNAQPKRQRSPLMKGRVTGGAAPAASRFAKELEEAAAAAEQDDDGDH